MRDGRVHSLFLAGLGLMACTAHLALLPIPAEEEASVDPARALSDTTTDATAAVPLDAAPEDGAATAGMPVGEPPDESPLAAADMTRTWFRLAVPEANAPTMLVRTPQGFVALVHESTPTGGKALGPQYHHLYASTDGITWTRLPALAPANNPYVTFLDFAYGAGRYLLAGGDTAFGTVFASSDLAQWTSPSFPAVDPDAGSQLRPEVRRLVRVNHRFFGFGIHASYSSVDGVTWTGAFIPLLQGRNVAFGNGTYVLAAALSLQVSQDGMSWAATSGGGSYNSVFLDRFYADAVSSLDGITWQPYGGPVVNHAVGGYLFNTSGDQPVLWPWQADHPLRAWRPGELPQTLAVEAIASNATFLAGVSPSVISTPLPGGETCATSRCVLLGRRLYLLR